jgi:hypothetical protein
MSKKYSIDVVTRLNDNGDGGYTMYVYNNEEELLKDHPKSDEMTPELAEEILSGNDEYENGYIGQDTIEIEVLKDGIARLIKPLIFHAGQ